MKMKLKKGQIISLDLIMVVTLVLFVVLFIVIYQISDFNNENKDIKKMEKKAREDSNLIINELKNNNIINNNDEVEISKLSNIDIETLKNDLGLKSDVAIYFEKDGKLVQIDPNLDINCLGNIENFKINGQTCK
jgi:hypothetical protein